MYSVLKAFTAYDNAGFKHQFSPGDKLPNIATWPNAEKYYTQKYITDAAGNLYSGRFRLTGKLGRAYLQQIEKQQGMVPDNVVEFKAPDIVEDDLDG